MHSKVIEHGMKNQDFDVKCLPFFEEEIDFDLLSSDFLFELNQCFF
jgi:hypothetical protein